MSVLWIRRMAIMLAMLAPASLSAEPAPLIGNDFSYDANGYKPETCAQDPQGAFWIRIYDAMTFAAPTDLKVKAMLQRLELVSDKARDGFVSEAITAQTGCPEQPLGAALAPQGEAYPPPILISAASPPDRVEKRKKMLARMREDGACEVIGEVLICAGRETEKSRKVQTHYIVAASGPITLKSGAPFYVRCKLPTCEIRDEFSPIVRVSTFAPLKREDFLNKSLKVQPMVDQIEAASAFIRTLQRP